MSVTEHPLEAVYRAVRLKLIESAEMWGNRVHLGIAPAGTERPYVVYSLADGSEPNRVRRQDFEALLLVKVVGLNLSVALTGLQRVATLLNDSGDQDVTPGLNAGTQWRITTVTKGRDVQFSEHINGVEVFHAGSNFRFRLALRP